MVNAHKLEGDQSITQLKDLKPVKIEETADTVHGEDGKTFVNQEAKDTYDRIVASLKKQEERKLHPVGSGVKRQKAVDARKRERQNKRRAR